MFFPKLIDLQFNTQSDGVRKCNLREVNRSEEWSLHE